MGERAVGLALVLSLVACKDLDQAEQVSSTTHAVKVTHSRLPIPALTDDRIGKSVAVDGNTLVVGAPNPDGNGNGKAVVFVRETNVWALQQTLTPWVNQVGQGFGGSVAISGDTLVAGAQNHDFGAQNSGAAYVFLRSNGTWNQQQLLQAPTKADMDYFGQVVDIENDTIIVGRETAGVGGGQVFVFVRTMGTLWTLSQTVEVEGCNNMESIALSGDWFALGCNAAIFVHQRVGTTWELQNTFQNSDISTNVGNYVDLQGPLLAMFTNTTVGSGKLSSVDLYTRAQPMTGVYAWLFIKKLSPQGGGTYLDHFGHALSIDGDRILIGSPGPEDSGVAYLFEKDASGWVQTQKIVPSDGTQSAFFGDAVALSGNVGVVGSWGWGDTGAAYVLGIGDDDGTACTVNETCASNVCSGGVCCATTCDGPCSACSIAAGGTEDGACTALSASTVCRPATGPCDKEETCTSVRCPKDELEPDDTPCPDGVCLAGVCTGSADGAVTDLGPEPQDGSSQDLPTVQDGSASDSALSSKPDAAEPAGTSGGCQIGVVSSQAAVPTLLLLALLFFAIRSRRH